MVVALRLLCLLTSVPVRVGRNTWLNAVFILLIAILKMSEENLSLHLKEIGGGMAAVCCMPLLGNL